MALETVKFEALPGGRTKVTSHAVRALEDRDGMLQSGVESGVIDSHERLDGFLEKMAK